MERELEAAAALTEAARSVGLDVIESMGTGRVEPDLVMINVHGQVIAAEIKRVSTLPPGELSRRLEKWSQATDRRPVVNVLVGDRIVADAREVLRDTAGAGRIFVATCISPGRGYSLTPTSQPWIKREA